MRLCQQAALWLAAAALAAPPAFASDDPASKDEQQNLNCGWFISDWGKKILAKTDLAASGTLSGSWKLPKGSTLGFFRIDKVFWGGTDEKSVMVFTPDPLLFTDGGTCVLFLKRLSGSRFTAHDVLVLSGEEGRKKLEACAALIEIEKLPTYVERIATFKDLILKNVESDDRWVRANALRELYILSKSKPGIFTSAELKALEESLGREKKSEPGRYLLSIITHIQVLPPFLKAVKPSKEGDTVEGVKQIKALLGESGIPERRRSFREEAVFDRFREEEDPEIRERMVRVIAYLDSPRLANGLGRAMAEDASPLVRAAAAEALASFPQARPSGMLVKALEDPIARVALAAAASLKKLVDRSAAEGIEKFLEKPSIAAEVRKAAEETLKALSE